MKRHIELITAAGVLTAASVGVRVGLLPRKDGWRRAAGLVLRGERSSFVLSSFGLRAGTPAGQPLQAVINHVRERLHSFLQGETSFHVGIRRSEREDRIEHCPSPSCTIAAEPWRDGVLRFVPPAQWGGERDGDSEPLFRFVVRVRPSGGEADVWVLVNHVGTDGAPVQEMLTRLEQAWGTEHVRYPSPNEFGHVFREAPVAGLVDVQAFVDMSPLLAWRKRVNAAMTEQLTVVGALMWWLGRQEKFHDRFIGSTAEIEPNSGLGRGVGIVVMRPSEYFGRPQGLASFAREISRQVSEARMRRSASSRTLDAAAYVPAGCARALLRQALERDPRAFGTLVISMLRDARVFGAPVAEFGQRDGFIAIGSASLPTSNGGFVASVVVRGPKGGVERHTSILERAVQASAEG
jgi:hypothetical protein